eukprot:1146292-Pelagomonas_calceolata.AAC.2
MVGMVRFEKEMRERVYPAQEASCPPLNKSRKAGTCTHYAQLAYANPEKDTKAAEHRFGKPKERKSYASGVSHQALIEERDHHGCKHREHPPPHGVTWGYKGKRPQSRRLTASLFINAHEVIR